MPDASHILAYEPHRRGRRRMHPILAAVVAHCMASYVIAIAALVTNVHLRHWPGIRFDKWLTEVLFHWLPMAPIRFPAAMGAYYVQWVGGRAPLPPRPLVWTLVYATLFPVTVMLLIRRR